MVKVDRVRNRRNTYLTMILKVNRSEQTIVPPSNKMWTRLNNLKKFLIFYIYFTTTVYSIEASCPKKSSTKTNSAQKIKKIQQNSTVYFKTLT